MPYPPSAQKGMSHMTNQTVVEKIADYIENHLEEDIPLDKIAKELNYSKFYIARVFADNTGYTIYKYIQGRRLTLAARKLAETDKPIVEIAYEARYGSQQAFTLAFSQFYLCKFRVSHKSISFFFQFADKHIQTFLHSFTGMIADNKRHLKFRMFTQRVEFPRVEISHKISVMLQYPVYQELIQPHRQIMTRQPE